MQGLIKTSFVLLLLVLQCFGRNIDNSLAGQWELDMAKGSGQYQDNGAKKLHKTPKMQELSFPENVMPDIDTESSENTEILKSVVDFNKADDYSKEETEADKNDQTFSNFDPKSDKHKNIRKKLCRTSFFKSRRERLETFQSDLLERLGISAPPTIRRSDVNKILNKEQRERIISVTRTTLQEGREDTGVISQFQRYPPSCDVPRKTVESVWNNGKSYRLYFDMENLSELPNDITAATLHLYMRPFKDYTWAYDSFHGGEFHSTNEDKTTVTLKSYTRPVKSKRRDRVEVVGHTQVAPSFEGWIKFDMLKTVRKWQAKALQRNFGLTVQLDNYNGLPMPANEIFDNLICKGPDESDLATKQTDRKYPSLEILTRSMIWDTKSRPKRDLNPESSSEGDQESTLSADFSQCVKEDLWVNLTELFEFILAPQNVNIGICVTRGAEADLPVGVSCDATKLTPLNVIFVKDGIIRGQVTNVIVKECGFVAQRRPRVAFSPARIGRWTRRRSQRWNTE